VKIGRRDSIQMAAAVGAACMWGGAAAASRVHWREPRDLFPEGVASGDPDPTSVRIIRMLLKHGVRSCLDYAKSGDLTRARSLSNPALSPHLSFVDLNAQGYAKVRMAARSAIALFIRQRCGSRENFRDCSKNCSKVVLA
jgi:alkaline phosphatase D